MTGRTTLICDHLQADKLAAALAEALRQLPAGSAIQQSLQADLPHYAQLLNEKLKELQVVTQTSEKQSSKKQKAAEAECLAEVCHRQA